MGIKKPGVKEVPDGVKNAADSPSAASRSASRDVVRPSEMGPLGTRGIAFCGAGNVAS